MKAGAALTTPSRRAHMVEQLRATGAPADKANQIVDVAFQAVDEAVAAFDRVLKLLDDQPGMQLNTMLIGRQVAQAEFNLRGETAVEYVQELSAKHGYEPSHFLSKD